MAKKSDEFDEFLDAVELKEPDGGDDDRGGPDDDDLEPVNGIWMRGVMMLILAAMFGLAQTVLAMVALVQFIWMLITKEKNQLLAEFGRDLAQLAVRRKLLFHRFQFVDHAGNHRQAFVPEFGITGVQPEGGQKL
jgi:hypothetical protein